jgi:hypothetical protein
MVIAFEDVGAASVDALLATVRAGIDPTWRTSVGGDERVIAYIARLFAEAPKDRSSDHLICSSRSYAPFEEARRMAGSRSLPERLHLVADADQPLHVRAIAAWYSSGVEWDDETRVGKGDLSGLTAVFCSIGVPKELAIATQHAATRTREPITIMVPLIWLEAWALQRACAYRQGAGAKGQGDGREQDRSLHHRQGTRYRPLIGLPHSSLGQQARGCEGSQGAAGMDKIRLVIAAPGDNRWPA